MAELCNPGAFAKLASGDWNMDDSITCKVEHIVKINEKKYSCTLSDGSGSMSGLLTSQIAKLLESGELNLPSGSIVKVNNPATHDMAGVKKIIVSSLELIIAGSGESPAIASTPQVKAQPESSKSSPEPRPALATPTVQLKAEPGTTPSAPAPAPKPQAKTPTPPSGAKRIPVYTPTPGRSGPPVQPLAALNPYDTNWRVRVKVSKKYPMRTFSRNGRENSVMNIELVDQQGTAIQATLWREACERYSDTLEEGKVYYMSRFQVKPANKAYSSVRNEYELSFDGRTEVEECEDQSSVQVVVKVDAVPIPNLHTHIGRQAPVDVCGVVTAVGQLGSVKRKSDSSEVPRRDITIADESGKTVGVTLWGQNATEKGAELEERGSGTVVAITNCRVNDYNGVSLSALTRSQVLLEPSDIPEAERVREWWQSEGSSASLVPTGQGLAAASGRGSGGARAEWGTIPDLTPEVLPSPDAKPTSRQVIVNVASINPDQTMYYLANSENGRKVVERDGQYWSEFDNKVVTEVERRYVVNFRVIDFRGEAYANAFNPQGLQLLGMEADKLAELKEGGEDGYQGVLKRAQWSEWVATIGSRSREYQGEVKMRHTVNALTQVDYAEQSRRMLALIQGY